MKQNEGSSQHAMPSHGGLDMFDIDGAGRLSASLPSARLGMAFCWRGRPVSSMLRADGAGAVITLDAQAGRMPTSAIDASARPGAFALLRLLPDLLPEGWTLTVGADHSLRMKREMRVQMPTLMRDLLVSAVQFCLVASPYFDLLEENSMGMRA